MLFIGLCVFKLICTATPDESTVVVKATTLQLGGKCFVPTSITQNTFKIWSKEFIATSPFCFDLRWTCNFVIEIHVAETVLSNLCRNAASDFVKHANLHTKVVTVRG